MQQQMEQQYFRNGGKPTEGANVNSKGELIDGTHTFTSASDIKDYFGNLKKQAVADAFGEQILKGGGMKANDFDKVISALAGQNDNITEKMNIDNKKFFIKFLNLFFIKLFFII